MFIVTCYDIFIMSKRYGSSRKILSKTLFINDNLHAIRIVNFIPICNFNHQRGQIYFCGIRGFKDIQKCYQCFFVCKRLISLHIYNNINIHVGNSLCYSVTTALMVLDTHNGFSAMSSNFFKNNSTIGNYKNILKQARSHGCPVGA